MRLMVVNIWWEEESAVNYSSIFSDTMQRWNYFNNNNNNNSNNYDNNNNNNNNTSNNDNNKNDDNNNNNNMNENNNHKSNDHHSKDSNNSNSNSNSKNNNNNISTCLIANTPSYVHDMRWMTCVLQILTLSRWRGMGPWFQGSPHTRISDR